MSHTTKASGATLLAGLVVIVSAATAPAGLGGHEIPWGSWAVWVTALGVALAGLRSAGVRPWAALRRIAWLAPLVALLASPAAMLAPAGSRLAVAGALAARALASASVAASLATLLGPRGIVVGARQLGVPARLVDVLAAAIGGLDVVRRQVTAMLRAREARRPAFGAWPRLIAAPRRTVRGFGRLVAALLLRTLERGEALERARRARGVAES